MIVPKSATADAKGKSIKEVITTQFERIIGRYKIGDKRT